jgi:hypothetical protein
MKPKSRWLTSGQNFEQWIFWIRSRNASHSTPDSGSQTRRYEHQQEAESLEHNKTRSPSKGGHILWVRVYKELTLLRTARPNGLVCSRSLAGIAGANPTVCMSVSCGCCVLSGRGFCVELITRPQESCECGVSECDRQASIMRRTSPTRGCYAMKKKTLPRRKTGNQAPNPTFCRCYACMHAACFNTPCTHRLRVWYIDTGICIMLYNLQTVCMHYECGDMHLTWSVLEKATAAAQYQGRRINFSSSTVHNSQVWKKQKFRRRGGHWNFKMHCEIWDFKSSCTVDCCSGMRPLCWLGSSYWRCKGIW